KSALAPLVEIRTRGDTMFKNIMIAIGLLAPEAAHADFNTVRQFKGLSTKPKALRSAVKASADLLVAGDGCVGALWQGQSTVNVNKGSLTQSIILKPGGKIIDKTSVSRDPGDE